MAKLHHMALKAAVAKFQPLVGTMTHEALKQEITDDEKGYHPDEIEEIYQAILPNAFAYNKDAEKLNQSQSGNGDSDSDDEDADESAADPVNKGPEKPAKNQPVKNQPLTYIVATEFRDKDDFSKIYSKGVDVSNLPKERLETLVELKHVVIV